jgi:hypothetical protein
MIKVKPTKLILNSEDFLEYEAVKETWKTPVNNEDFLNSVDKLDKAKKEKKKRIGLV